MLPIARQTRLLYVQLVWQKQRRDVTNVLSWRGGLLITCPLEGSPGRASCLRCSNERRFLIFMTS